MSKPRNVIHATFTLERTYPTSRERVFAAFADENQKRTWAYGAPDGAHKLDFRVGGREQVAMPGPGGGTFTYNGVYQDIVDNERIIYTYDIDFGGGCAAVTMATIELSDADGGTKLKFTEQGAYLDGFDGPKFWESGTTSLLDRLGKSLA